MPVWRLQTLTGANNSIAIDKYCLDHNVAAMGWSLRSVSQTQREGIGSNFAEYERLARIEYPDSKCPVNSNVCRLATRMQTGDLIWMRSGGQYYIAKVKDDSRWYFDAGAEATDLDASCQIVNVHWHKVGEEDKVPGAINTGFFRGQTLQRINKGAICEYSQIEYNRAIRGTDETPYPSPSLKLDERSFYNLLQPDDAEDLLCMWLYKKEGYVCIPSTKKKSTEKYEFTLIDPKQNPPRYCYPQVKKGAVALDARDYQDLDGEVYLFSTEGKVTHCDEFDNTYRVDPTELFEFAISEENSNYIPEGIRKWARFLAENDTDGASLETRKGIMFDTNKAYSNTNESEMLSNGRIEAYGNAARYVDHFNLDDYALFYSKGRGIIAVGKITSEEATHGRKPNGDAIGYQTVRLIVPDDGKREWESVPSITAREIKEILGRGFYFASTIKAPYLTETQVELLIKALKAKYE